MDDKPHVEGMVNCGSCGSVYRAHRAGETCANCGATLPEASLVVDLNRRAKYVGVFAFLKPLADSMDGALESGNMLRYGGGPSLTERIEGPVICGWCRRPYDVRPKVPNCESCGGVLPTPPDSDLGPPPAAGPRQLPREFFFNLYIKQNIGGLLGLGLMLLALPFLLFPAVWITLLSVGFVFAYSNFAQALRRQMALARGTPVPGRIARVDRIGEQVATNHGSVLYRVYFRFDVNDRALLGMKYTYDPAITRHFIGQPIWVVCFPRRPKYYAIWPPLA